MPKKEVNRFDFDFRYYSPYTGPELKKSGVYIFKTANNDSLPIDYYLSRVQSYEGRHMSQIILHFTYPGHEPCTIVKIKMRKTSEQLEFDIFFARIAEFAPP